MTSVTEVRSASARLFARSWCPLVSVITVLCCVAIIFHRRVWYGALSLCYAGIGSSDIILIHYANFLPNFVSFAASIAQLAYGEKSRTQSFSHSFSLFDAPGTEALALRNLFLSGLLEIFVMLVVSLNDTECSPASYKCSNALLLNQLKRNSTRKLF